MKMPYASLTATTVLAAMIVVGCERSSPVKAAVPAAQAGEVLLPINSPKFAYITVQAVRARTEKVVAILPAQLVMDEDRTVRVFSPVTGRITRLVAQPGDHVSPRQPLAYIQSGDAAQSTSDLSRARASATLTTAALHRSEDLYTHHVVALKDLEQARSDDAQAQAELGRASARASQLGTGSTGNGDFVLRAPLGGQIVDRTANPGAEVRPDAQTPLFTISDLKTLWLTAAAYQHDLPMVRVGQRLSFTTDAVPGRQFVATVSFVAAALDPQTRTATLRATLDNTDRLLRPQIFGQARLLAPAEGDVPVVPSGALVTHGNETVVFVEVAPGHFARRSVTVADDDGTTAAITSGLHVGERVVTRGSLLLSGEVDAGNAQ